MGPGKKPEECEIEELVSEFGIARHGGDCEFALEYRQELTKRINELISFAMWSIRRLPKGYDKSALLHELKRTVGEDHEYAWAIDEMIAEVTV